MLLLRTVIIDENSLGTDEKFKNKLLWEQFVLDNNY